MGVSRVDGRRCTAETLRTVAAVRERRVWTAAVGKAASAMALGEAMRQELERIFRLLGLLYPHLDLH